MAQKNVEVADAEVKAAKARLDEARAILGKYEAEVKRWDVQVKRLAREVERNVVAPQILLESQNELERRHRRARRREGGDRQGGSGPARRTRPGWPGPRSMSRSPAPSWPWPRARRSGSRRWVGYLKLFAPYDGIVVARNANTWDFVLPSTGDPTAEMRAPHLSPGGQAAPIYVVDRTDIVRIYVDVPERDADFVHIGSEARVKLWAYRDEWLPASVTRLSWALNIQSRTMRTEIDLPNPGSQILPGMYAYGKVVVERPNVRALPKVRPHLCRRQVLHLAVRQRPRRTHRSPDRRQGRRMDRGH